jgi:UDP-N-acetylmuramate--alanine ligase
VSFVDGYDHLPSEVSAAIATAKLGDWSRVVVIFQPHRYSRTQALWRDFADCFVGADVVVIAGIYAAGETPRPGVDERLIADAAANAHPEIEMHRGGSLAETAELVAKVLKPGDLCLTLGAGDITKMPDMLLEVLRSGLR